MTQRMKSMQQVNHSIKRQNQALIKKISELIEEKGVYLDSETSADLSEIMKEKEDSVLASLPQESFNHIFWEQQKKAASIKDPKGMRWHPAIIKWCIYLRHQSNKAYETLRGCIRLPSQRTLRDYTHCTKAAAGFCNQVDQQLLQALESSKEHERMIILLLDEMYIREDLVYNKHSGQLVGYINMGDINNHLLLFEKQVTEGDVLQMPTLAKTMMVFTYFLVFASHIFYSHVLVCLETCCSNHFGIQCLDLRGWT